MRWNALAAAVTGLALSACGLSVQDAASQFGQPYCKKVLACFPDSFYQEWPGGLPACEAQFTVGYSNNDLSASAGCSGAQLNTCLSDIDKLPAAPNCGASIDAEPLPASCDVCAGKTQS